MLDWIKEWRHYLSLKDTKILCKSCAYVENMIDEELTWWRGLGGSPCFHKSIVRVWCFICNPPI